jgi:putative NIF3 family GTP cyclohydrolase 1 type 2
MNARELYKKLDTDFELDNFTDSWPGFDLGEYMAENFKKRQMGLVLDNSENINKAYTAVFPSDAIIQKILDSGEQDILLFTHHPRIWDLSLPGFPFKDFDHAKLPLMKERKISFYALHVPLDNNGEYSTSVTFAKAIGIEKEEDFAPYGGGMAGVIGRTGAKNISELAEKVRQAVGHEIKIFNHASDAIKDQKTAIIAGGGNDPEIIKEVIEKGKNTYLTGVTAVTDYPPTVEFAKLVKENNINVISATHYSTEKFACIEMCRYFENLSIPCEFLEDEADMKDIG